MSDSGKGAVGGEPEPDDTVSHSLDHVGELLDNINKVGVQSLAPDTKKKLSEMKRLFQKLNLAVEDKPIELRDKEWSNGKSTGAIPKIKKLRKSPCKTENCRKISDSSTNESIADSSSSYSSSRDKIININRVSKKRYSKKKVISDSSSDNSRSTRKTRSGGSSNYRERKQQKESNNDMNDLVKALQRLDSRKAPKQEPFDEKSGKELKVYFRQFEKHCVANVRGDESDWIGELEDHLRGDILVAFRTMRGMEDSYRVVKKKLLKWFDNLKEQRRAENKKAFKNAKYVRGESLYLFSSRLQKLYEIAYPSRDVSSSKSLVEKFIASVPTKDRESFNNLQISYKMKNRNVRWRTVQKCARLRDAALEKEAVRTDSDERKDNHVREVIISTAQKTGKDDNSIIKTPTGNSPRNDNRVVSDLQFPASSRPNTPRFAAMPHVRAQQQYRTEFRPRFYSSRGNMNRPRAPYNPRVDIPVHRGPGNNMNRVHIWCNYCKLTGHSVHECRSRQNLCYACGQMGHYYRECVKYTGNTNGNNQLN